MKSTILFFGMILGMTNITAQDWEFITTPVMSNLILYDIQFPPGQSDIGYAVGSSLTFNGKGRILKTTDNGVSWELVYENETAKTGLESLYFFDTDRGLSGNQDGKLMKTNDGGLNWNSVNIDTSTAIGSVLRIHFTNDNQGVLISQWGGAYYTVDGGDSWTAAGESPLGALDMCHAEDSIYYACGNNSRVWKSTDLGLSWTMIFEGQIQSLALGIDFRNKNEGFITSEEGFYRRTFDGGETWVTGVIPNQYGLNNDVFMVDDTLIYVLSTPGQVTKSIDDGQSWMADSPFDPDPSYYRIVQLENGTKIVCGSRSDGGTILRKAGISTALNEKSSSERLKVFPNPSQGEITISGLEENTRGEIWSSHGVLIETFDSRKKSFDLIPGEYIIRSIEKKGIATRTFVVIE